MYSIPQVGITNIKASGSPLILIPTNKNEKLLFINWTQSGIRNIPAVSYFRMCWGPKWP